MADGGNLCPDEIGELDSHVQIKLLRVLEIFKTPNGSKFNAAKMPGVSTRKIEYKIKE